MRAFRKLALTEAKLYLREPSTAFMTLVFPVFLVLIFGSVYGNDPADVDFEFGEYGFLDTFAPGLIAFIIATSAFLSLSSALATYRDQGTLRRFHATPLQPVIIFVAEFAVYVGVTAVGALFLVAIGVVLFDLAMPAAPLSLLIAFVFSTVCVMSLGVLLGSLAPTARAAEAAGLAIFFPLIFLSGAMLPRDVMPEAMQQASQVLPLTHVVTLMRDLWIGDGWNLVSLGVLGAFAAVGIAVSVRVFRWE
jgi:ABC-2 type transport system permease protein